MRQVILFAFCLGLPGLVLAQGTKTTKTTTTTTKTTTTTTKATKAVGHGSAIGGTIRNARFQPLNGVQAFIYAPDSSIIASGYTDVKGNYETNGVVPGKYDLKILYPSNKAVIIKGVPVKGGVTQVNLNANPPDSDTIMQYADIAPKPEKKTEKKKA